MFMSAGRSADILSASGRSPLVILTKNLFDDLFALRAQADRMSALRLIQNSCAKDRTS
jgi:hypothetical protein